jgi:hypothetical protein
MTLTHLENRIKPRCDALVAILRTTTITPEVRPFVCHGTPYGDPLQRDVMVVGYNPATPMPGNSFWTFWSSSHGFDYSSWFASYSAIRKAAGKRGKSPTRRILDAISGVVPTVETNLYPIPTPKAKSLKGVLTPLVRLRSYAILCELVRCVRPKVIITHGDEAASLTYGLPCCGGVRVNRAFLNGSEISGRDVSQSDGEDSGDDAIVGVDVIAESKHFGRGFSEKRAIEIAEQAKKISDRS